MKIEWLPKAAHNLNDQLAYIGEHNPAAAIDVGDAVESCLSRLADFPESGRPGRLPGTRELVVTRTPFIVVYRIEPAAVVILRVLHAAQRWP